MNAPHASVSHPSMTLTLVELGKLKGRYITIQFPPDGTGATTASAEWYARIVDIRKSYGRIDYLIQPVGGCGAQWVAAKSVALMVDGWEPDRLCE